MSMGRIPGTRTVTGRCEPLQRGSQLQKNIGKKEPQLRSHRPVSNHPLLHRETVLYPCIQTPGFEPGRLESCDAIPVRASDVDSKHGNACEKEGRKEERGDLEPSTNGGSAVVELLGGGDGAVGRRNGANWLAKTII
jgi:hypothetical protein